MVQGRQRVKSYKIHIQERVPEEDWFIVENTHEAIIDREIFDKVQGLLKRDTRTAPKAKQLYLFSGFLKCADCGRAMSRIASKGIYVYYQCGTYKSLSKKACTMHSIKSDRLEAASCLQFNNRYIGPLPIRSWCPVSILRPSKKASQSGWRMPSP